MPKYFKTLFIGLGLPQHPKFGIHGYGYNPVYTGQPKAEPFSVHHLDFVHGTVDDLLAGKKCVVRDKVTWYEETAPDQWESVWQAHFLDYDRPPFLKGKIDTYDCVEGRLLFIGKTPNFNSVVVLKPWK